MPTFSDPTTGWSGNYLTDPSGTRPPAGGLVLTDVQHDGHNFARDLRTVGIRLKIQQVDSLGTVMSTVSRFLPLSDPPFTVGTISTLTPSPVALAAPRTGTFMYLREADDVLQFNTYFKDATGNYVGYGFRVDYQLPATWFTTNFPNCEVDRIDLSQRFLFSRYGNNPVHEPGGVLRAARCHPTIKYAMHADASVNRTRPYHRIASIRFDFRFYLFIDRNYASPTAAAQIGNQAGLFRDQESVSISRSTSRGAFAAVEKPLIFEVATQGLEQGLVNLDPRTSAAPPSSPTVGWDNLHWWGARGAGNPIISAPGAFHAAHMHWRWGAAGTSTLRRGVVYPQIDNSGVPTAVQSHPWGGSSTRTLVDPQIWIQTLRIAVSKNDATLDPTRGATLESLARENWPTLFTTLRGTPIDISVGDDIIFWYSTEVHRSTTLPGLVSGLVFTTTGPALTYYNASGGSVLIHGFFFAHNAEISVFGTGDTTPNYWPNDESAIRASPAWRRTA